MGGASRTQLQPLCAEYLAIHRGELATPMPSILLALAVFTLTVAYLIGPIQEDKMKRFGIPFFATMMLAGYFSVAFLFVANFL